MTAQKKAAERPSIRVRARGRLASITDELARLYREANPERDCRWVYAPTHKPELANVLTRRAQGYQEVTVNELPEAKDLMTGASPDDAVRIGDVILMSIEAEVREIYKEELYQLAKEQGEQVQTQYYEKIAEESQKSSISGRKHKAAAKGSVKIEERELEYEYEQKTSEEEGEE